MELIICRPDKLVCQSSKLTADMWRYNTQNLRLIYITMIDTATGWFKIKYFLLFDIDEVTEENNQYIYK